MLRQKWPLVRDCRIKLKELNTRSYGVMAITLDFESNNPSSNLGSTLIFYLQVFSVDDRKQVIKQFVSPQFSRFPQCSGYHVRLTRERSPVRARAETILSRTAVDVPQLGFSVRGFRFEQQISKPTKKLTVLIVQFAKHFEILCQRNIFSVKS